jgi:medium-chain acyl-[acyl-carrier-protein] hydrolase
MGETSDRWVVRQAPRDGAAARLFCFPHAGVGASVYRSWSPALPAGVEVCAIQLPGRESRMREPRVASIPRLVEALTPALLPHLDRPFAFFGHSMGAVLAAEVARALEERGASAPTQLMVSAHGPPHLPSLRPPMRALSDAEFVVEVQRRYGGIRPEILAEPELLALLLPTLRADIAALELHQPGRRAPLSCPITAFGGEADALTPRPHLEAWREETHAPFRLRVFPGGHFYLEACRAELLAEVGRALAPSSSEPLRS